MSSFSFYRVVMANALKIEVGRLLPFYLPMQKKGERHSRIMQKRRGSRNDYPHYLRALN